MSYCRRMRWLSLAVLGACQFTPGAFPGAGDGGADALRDARDASRVRRLDPQDAKIVGGPHADFSLLVSVTSDWLKTTANGGSVAHDTGHDIHFALDPGGATPLFHEIEEYEPATGSLVAWVRMPALAADTVLYVRYGDAARTTQPSASLAWSSSYALVVHPAGAGDSTAAATNVQAFDTIDGAGKIGPARIFDGSNSYVDASASTAIANIFAGGGTAEAWFYAESFGESQRGRVMDKGGGLGWAMLVNDNGVNESFDFVHGCTGATNGGQWGLPPQTTTLGVWHHIAVVYNKDDVANVPLMYLDGTARTLTTVVDPSGTMVTDSPQTLLMGRTASGTRDFDGLLDELRLSRTMRDAGWISTQFQNQSMPATFMTVSAEL